MNSCAYLSLLATDDFLPGILVLARSLRLTGARYPLVVLVTTDLKADTLAELTRHGIEYQFIDPIPLPQGKSVKEARWIHIYNKLRIFEQDQFHKAVYLDADMLIFSNIDELFDRPHMSAVNAGGRLWITRHWTGLNGGLLVIEPDRNLFAEMMEKVGKLDDRGEGDQGFLNSFYPDWPQRSDLHLDHAFNQLHLFLDAYWLRFGYRVPKSLPSASGPPPHPKEVKVIHYITSKKPWIDLDSTRRQASRKRWLAPQQSRALRLWLECYDELRTSAPG